MIVILEQFVKVSTNFENVIENFKRFLEYTVLKILIKIWKKFMKILKLFSDRF